MFYFSKLVSFRIKQYNGNQVYLVISLPFLVHKPNTHIIDLKYGVVEGLLFL